MRAILLAVSMTPLAALCDGFAIYNICAYSPGRERVVAHDAVELRDRTGEDLAMYDRWSSVKRRTF